MNDLASGAAVPVPFPGRPRAGNSGAAAVTAEPAPLNPRQERFCRAYALSGNAARAAREAGYAVTGAKHRGHRLLRRPEVRARVRALQARLAREDCARTEALLAKLENVYQRAVDDHHFHAAARAVEIQARLAGLLADPRVSQTGDGNGRP